jgi:hypothetical protein
LDLPDIGDVTFQGSDRELALESMSLSTKYLTSPKKYLVEQLLLDSMTLNPEDYAKKFQFIFIDANHELKYVKKDTENALKMLAPGLSCIVWHDYGNPQFPELTQYLNALSLRIKIYHIGDTMLAFYLIGKEVAPVRI